MQKVKKIVGIEDMGKEIWRIWERQERRFLERRQVYKAVAQVDQSYRE